MGGLIGDVIWTRRGGSSGIYTVGGSDGRED